MNETVEKWLRDSPVPTDETLRLWVVVGALTLAWGLSAGWTKRVRALALVPPLVLAIIAIGRALQTAWLADDAFITFRYSANWAHGLGAVWNAGERVEGYTNPLWMAVLAAGEWLGAPAPFLATALNLTMLVALIGGTWWAMRKAFADQNAVPVLPIVLALSPAVREFGTSGLETLPASAAVTGAALCLLLGARLRTAGALVCLAAMLRPDHALFFAPLGFAAIAAGSVRARVRNALDLAVPAVVFAVFWVVRWRWYGDFYPNTYYAKSASVPYWDQGWIYVTEFVASTRVWWPVAFAPLAAMGLWLTSRNDTAPSAPPSRAPFFVFTVVGGLLWLTYVARVGGDFMEFRFALTALPVLGLAAEALVWSQTRAAFAPRLALAFVAMLPLAQSRGLIGPRGKTEYIALESSFYPVTQWTPVVIDNPIFRQAVALAATKPPSELLAAGCIGMLGYYNQSVPIFDTYGKTSREVARRPIEKRGRPGHEKVATREDLRNAGVVWSIDPIWNAFNEETHVRLREANAWVVRLDDSMSTWSRAVGQPVEAARVLARVTDATTALEHVDELGLMFERNPVALDQRLMDLHVVPPRQFSCDAQGRCESTLECHDELVSLTPTGGPCTVSTNGAVAATWARCDGTTRVVVSCPTAARWVLSREPAELSARMTAARARGPVAVANAARVGGLKPKLGENTTACTTAESASSTGSAKPAAAAAWRCAASADEVMRVDFEGALPEGVQLTGEAMTIVPGTAPRQIEVVGFEGAALLNTYAPGDEARGEFKATVALDPSSEHVISLRFGGGKDCALLFAQVLVDGHDFGKKACGLDDERLRQHAWLIPRGARSLEVRAVDESSAGWGHLLLDDVGVWRLP